MFSSKIIVFATQLLIILLVIANCEAMAQSVSGHIRDEKNLPVPGVSIYIKDGSYGTSSDQNGYYFLSLDPGHYELIYSAIGFEPQTISIFIEKKHIKKDVVLKEANYELEQLVVKANRRDPAYEIIQNAIKAKKKYSDFDVSYSSNIYIKAFSTGEDIKTRRDSIREMKKLEKLKEEDEDDGTVKDPFDQRNNKALKEAMQSAFAEIRLERHYRPPNDVKEIRTAVQELGDPRNLYFLTTVRSNFNFYKNLVHAPDLSETPFISPLNDFSVITYKFKLVETVFENERMVYKIKVIPRKKSNSTVQGYIYINDELWNINRLDISMSHGDLLRFDEVRLQQFYTDSLHDSLWVIQKQKFEYKVKNRQHKQSGSTLVRYSDFKWNVEFPRRFFSNELGVTTKEAYERDSVYWNKVRSEELSKEEKRIKHVHDSIETLRNNKDYLDSLDRVFNKFTFGKLAYSGWGIRNRDKKKEWNFSPALDLINPFQVGGIRYGPYVSYFKKWKSERWFSASTNVDYGPRNENILGNAYSTFRYDPFRSGTVVMSTGKILNLINPYDAYINLIKRSNYYETSYITGSNSIELVNGLYANIYMAYENRNSINDYSFAGTLDNIIGETNPYDFGDHQALRTRFRISFIPGQKYLREPKRKVVLGSKFPEFGLNYEKGVEGLFGSDINYDFLQASIEHLFKLSTLGTSKYRVTTGKYLNTKKLNIIDYQVQRQSDLLLFSNPLYSFQTLDTTLPTLNHFFEGHYIHHFNGAVINNFPIIKKLRLKFSAGGGVLWEQKTQYKLTEAFFGLERIFRIQRQRFKVGLFYAAGVNSNSGFIDDIKISFDLYNYRENRWGF